MTTLRIEKVPTDDPTELMFQHSGRSKPQHVWVVLLHGSAELIVYVDQRHPRVTSQPYPPHSWRIPPMRPEGANRLLDLIAPLAERVYAGTDLDRFDYETADADSAVREIEDVIARFEEDLDRLPA